MKGRRMPLGEWPKEPGDYMGPMMGYTGDVPAVFFLLPNACPPRWLMCRACWSKVPIAHVAMLVEPNKAKRDAYLAHAMEFADTLEARGT
jgi:hypothetical protein